MTRWVLLRGLTRESRHWGDFPAQLAAATGWPCTGLDLPGNGDQAHTPSPTGVAGMVAFTRQALQAQGIQPPYSVLAMSLGGMVATHWAQQHPAELARLVLVNTSMRPHNRLVQRLRPQRWPALAAIARHWGQPEAVETRVHGLTCNRTDTLVQDVANWRSIRQSAPVRSANAWRQLLAAARFSAQPEAPACPVLLLSSAQDRLVNPVCSATVATAWQATHRQHPWAGHDLPHDDAPWVCDAVAAWLPSAVR